MSQFQPAPRGAPFALRSVHSIFALSFALFLSGCASSAGTNSGGSSVPITSPNVNVWTWMSGSNSTSAPGVYGTQGIASVANVPGARSASVSWTDASGNFWLFGGGGYGQTSNSVGVLNDLWEFNPANKEWTWVSGSNSANAFGVYGTEGVSAVANVPGARDDAVSWIDTSGNLWIFGGSGNSSTYNDVVLNDLWEFNPANKEWTWVSGSSSGNASGVYGTPGLGSVSNVPGGRIAATSWTDSSGNFWLFGGNTGSRTKTYNDLWKFSPSNKTWTWISGSNTVNAVGVYGTKGVVASGDVPSSRYSSVSWMDSSGNFWLFGGSSGNATTSDLNDLWEFSTITYSWTWISGSNTAGSIQVGVYGTQGTAATANLPGSRDSAVSWADSSGDLWLFGGQGYDSTGTVNGSLNDLWKFNPTGKQWTWVSGSSALGSQSGQPGVYGTMDVAATGNVSGGRSGAVAWKDGGGNLWLFGGESSRMFNDLWRYQP